MKQHAYPMIEVDVADGNLPAPPTQLGIQSGTEPLSPDTNPPGIPRYCDEVAIVGFAPSSMSDVQFLFGKQNVEIWAINQLYVAFPAIVPSNRIPEKRNVTRWFQIHHRHSYDQTVSRDHSHHEWLAKMNEFPIYMQRKEPDIPCSVEFPVQLILNKFRRYFTNSISWEIALAILEGFKKIYLFGIDMAQDSEYMFERPSVEYFCGYAEGAGIELVVPEKSDILKSAWLYPFEQESIMRTKIESRRKELRERINYLSAQESGAHDERMMLLGAIENMHYVQRSWSNAARELEGTGFDGKDPNAPFSPPSAGVHGGNQGA